MKLVYIAGPFRGATPWDVAENVRNAERVGLEVAKLGAFPIIPHANAAHFDGQLIAQFWLDGTLALLRRCDALLAIDGWEGSSGTREEIREANKLSIPVFYEIDHVRGWLQRTAYHVDLTRAFDGSGFDSMETDPRRRALRCQP